MRPEVHGLLVKTLLRFRWLIVSACTVGLVAGCGDPGLPSPGVALVSGSDGARSIQAETCGPPDGIKFSPGNDLWGDSTITLKFSDRGTASHTVDLPDAALSGSFVQGDQADLDALRAPFSVRLTDEGGSTWAVVNFSEYPAEGTAALVVTNGDSAPTVVDIADVDRLLKPDCW